MYLDTCIHCERHIGERTASFRYPESGAVAHLACVSQPSSSEMDGLLLAHSYARRALNYQSEWRTNYLT